MTNFFSGPAPQKTAEVRQEENGRTQKRKGEKNMSKVKKVLAIILSMAMILGMSLTTFAAEFGTITIKNAGTGSFKAVQVVVPDNKADTGWEIVDEYQNEFLEAFTRSGANTTQAIIKGMIASLNPTASEAVPIAGFDGYYQNALQKVLDTISAWEPDDDEATSAVDGVANITGNSPDISGVWAIKGLEDGYNYSPMAAYFDFGAVITDNINAKKAPDEVTKTVEQGDEVAEIGKTVTYKLTSTVPYVPLSDQNRTYTVKDTITNASYVPYNNTENPDDENNGKVQLTVKLTAPDGTEVTPEKFYYADITPLGNNQQTFTATLNNLLENNTYANYSIEISYKATINGDDVNNAASINDGEFGSDSTKVYTGTIELTKTNDDEIPQPLADAKFVVRSEEGKYATFTYDQSAKEYKFTGTWIDKYENEDGFVENAIIETDADGKALIAGFDDQTTYTLVEVEAPEGYSLAADNSNIVWSGDNNARVGKITVVDTKLASLPGTGGIGTTIFTIGGCVIMIAAAGLYFASRRKQENK